MNLISDTKLTKKNKIHSFDLNAWLEEVENVQPLDRSKIAVDGPKKLKSNLKLNEEKRVYNDYKPLKEFNPLKANDKSDIDANTRKRMDRGNLEIEAVLDLHNKNLENAFLALLNFINQSYNEAKRLLLVITGKGNKSMNSSSLIKNEIVFWFNDTSIRGKIVRFSQAHKKHGGGGAFYVLLKRHRIQKQ